MAGPVRIMRMGGSSIAAPAAAAWITDFFNAAYYARPADERDVDDLRLALCVLTTRWARRGGRRLGARDLPAFHRAFGTARLGAGGRLDRAALLEGAAGMLGDWFPGAYGDPERRAHGVVFETVDERRAYDPALRLARATLAPLDPPRARLSERQWSTYPPVPLVDPAAAVRFLCDPARWPDIACAAGWFTAVRAGGLPGVTFEIDVSAALVPRAPIFTRAYVTCTEVHVEGPELERAAAGLGEHVSDALPPGATPLAFLQLTSHRGHFLGRAHSHLLVYEDGDGAFVRDVGCWDPLPAHLSAAYATAGREAQQAFWGPEPADLSMLAQLARVTSRES